MRKVKIITDSCSDLNGELMAKYDIDYARMCTVYNGESTPALLTRTPEEFHEFYEIMRAGNRILTTQVPVEEFITVFTKYLEEGYDIVYIACAVKQSGSVNTAQVVSRDLLKKYPDASIFCVDSMNASLGEGLLAIQAAMLVKEGLSAQEVNDRILAIRKNVNEFVTVHSLDALRRCGRVKASAAFFGNLMGIKPILIADADGTQVPIKKAKGRQASFREIVALLKEAILNPEEQTVYVAHADCSQAEVDVLVSLVKQEIPCKDVVVTYIGAIIGASIGPDAVGIWAMGKEVTFRG